MKLKHSLLITASTLLVLMSASSHAGRTGVNSFYGLGLGAAVLPDADAAPTGEVIIGIEEDGWALEGIAFASTEVGTDVSTVDTSISGKEIGLGYRSIEKNHRYYKFKVSKTDLDIETKTTSGTTTFSNTTTTEGNSYTVGMGFRMDRDARLEVDYVYHNNDDLTDPVHFLMFRYLWGGAPYQGTSL